ncbi:hypothetical protein Rhow_006303 [Rhodococcus wratislaviensis]|uniref:Uncharacterized protein n=1 Tax=Rhodococcus wratislaviensis TaxID=44752 RepID=A0A402CFL7_RHOWR|nr:hypothetical protein Rhow_006303 [Rhodococcus wratislaviensis]
MTIGECTASSVDHDNSQAVRRTRTRPALRNVPPPLSPARVERLRDSVPSFTCEDGPFPVGGWVLPPLSRGVGARTVLFA